LLSAINADDGAYNWLKGGYSAAKAQKLRSESFDRHALASRDLLYEQLDQLTVELLLGVR